MEKAGWEKVESEKETWKEGAGRTKEKDRGEEIDREVEKESDSDEWISWTVMVSVQLRLERKEWLPLKVYMNRALLE